MTKIVAAVLVLFFVAWVGFAFGRFYDGYSNAVERATAKAELRIDHLGRLDEIEGKLKRGCQDAALYLVRSGVDAELRSLNVIVGAKENTGYQALQKMKDTEPEVLARMRVVKAQHNEPDAAPLCAGTKGP